MKQIVSGVAGVILGILSNYIYEQFRQRGWLPNQPTVRFLSVLTAVVCALIFLVVWPDLGGSDSAGSPPLPTPSVTATNTLSREVTYSGRVRDASSQAPIAAAKVTLDVTGAPPVVYTDGEGVFRFPLRLDGETLDARVRVDADGYTSYDRVITIFPSITQLEDIRLNPNTVTPFPTSAVTVESTVTLPQPTTTFPPTPTNLILQSSFDTSADGWEGYDNLPLAPQAGMVCSTQQPQNRDPWAGIRTDPHISVTPGKHYRVVVRFNTERAVNAHVRVAYHNHSAASADIAIPNPTSSFIGPKAGWQDVPLSTIAPLGAQDLLIRIGHGVEPGGGAEPDGVVPDSILCIDDVQVFEE